MEGQGVEYWIPPQEYYPAPARGAYDYTPDAASVPSLSASPTSTTFEVPTPNAPPAQTQQYQQQYFQNPVSPFHGNVTYQPNLPVTPSEFGSADETTSPCFSPRRGSSMELNYANFSHEHQAFQQVPIQMQQSYGQQATWSVNGVVPTERTHTTSGRRRAQNRAAQRAFRERKEKHARDLEAQLALLSDKYTKLETSHAELSSAYEKLRRVIHLLTSDEAVESGSMSPLDEDALLKGTYVSGEGFADMDSSSSSSEGKAAALRRVIGSVVEAGQGGGGGAALRGRDGERVRKLVEILNGELAAGGAAGSSEASASAGGSGKGGIKCEV
ncbi:hypothetical protein IWX90DRAFT_131701 [Phyllosticta citrichinensis]|uniref:BZIP domain-containing protein n=1 Tax=Phyllosticta citrichinensis TaxID=1130410 RepID=A0ABR1Y4U9_9PEZI